MQRHPSGRSHSGASRAGSGPLHHSGASRAGSGPLHRSAHMSQEPSIIDELADVPTALHNYFQSLVQSQGDKRDHGRWVACLVQGSWSSPPPPCKIVSRVPCPIGYNLTWTFACESSSCASMLASSAQCSCLTPRLVLLHKAVSQKALVSIAVLGSTHVHQIWLLSRHTACE